MKFKKEVKHLKLNKDKLWQKEKTWKKLHDSGHKLTNSYISHNAFLKMAFQKAWTVNGKRNNSILMFSMNLLHSVVIRVKLTLYVKLK